MHSFLFLLPSLLPFFVIGFAYLILRLTKKLTPETLSRLRLVLASFAVIMGWVYFFEDKQTIFECRKPSLTCVYYHSTIADPKLRFVRSYDLNSLQHIELKTEKRRKGKYSTRNVYKIVFHSETAQDEFPETFDIEDWAQEEIGKINRFLQDGKKQRYVYREGSEEINEFDQGIKFSFFLTTTLFFVWILYDRRKKIKKSRKNL